MVLQGEVKLSDKEIEQKFDIIGKVVALGFEIPPNVGISML